MYHGSAAALMVSSLSRGATTTESRFAPTCGCRASAGRDRNGPRTYMALKVRVALQPGQRPSSYQANGSHGLCSYR